MAVNIATETRERKRPTDIRVTPRWFLPDPTRRDADGRSILMKQVQKTHPLGLVLEILRSLVLGFLKGAVAGIAIAGAISFVSKRAERGGGRY
jgi:hypothetical protein